MPPTEGHIEVVVAHRTEALLEALVAELGSPLSDPVRRECIVVQSAGMARWLELALSARLGILANAWFPFPEDFLRALDRAAGDPGHGPAAGAPDRAALGWATAAALPPLLDRPAFAPLRGWLGPAREPGRLLALARRIAEVFDRYRVDRPDLLLAWEEDPDGAWLPPGMPAAAAEDAAWQAPLWRAVVAREGAGARYAARRAATLHRRLTGEPVPGSRLARFERVSVFGLSALSPLYLGILAALARHRPVRLYTLAPSPVDAERLRAAALRDTAAGMVAETGTAAAPAFGEEMALAAPAPAHPLLESQARPVRAFQVLLARAGATAGTPEVHDGSGPATEDSLLAALRADIVADRAPVPCPERVRAALAGDDRSLGLHSCHGPLREVEVLRDQLLQAFDDLEDLAPHEVIVMVPDVEAYAPYVEAVFDPGEGAGPRIPYHLADRPAHAERPGAQAFLRLLQVLRGRMTAPEIVDLLALAPVRDARGLDEADVERLRGWVEEAGIRWGLDAAHRAAVGQPALAANTWRWGLERLALGWAAPGDGRARFHDTLPYAAAGAEPALVGALAAFLDDLGRWRAALLDGRWGLADWVARLGRTLGELVGPGPRAEDDRVFVEAALGSLAEQAGAAGFDAELGLDAVADLVAGSLDERPSARGFLEGAVTVCSVQPMRAIPFRVVALGGLNDGVFPRGDHPPAFDLAARQPRLGDTSRRDADRQLFLEALLSARERLILSWTGQDERSDLDLPPAVVVSELLDVLERMATGLAPGGGGPARELVLRHRLHPFSPRYFGERPDPRWFSYSAAYAVTAARSGGARHGRPGLLARPLPPWVADEAELQVPLEALARYLEAPARHFVRNRLGMELAEAGQALADREPMVLGPLDGYAVGQAILEALLAGDDPAEAVAAAVAEGRLPLGTPGALAVAPVRATAEDLAALAAPLRVGGPARTAAVDWAVPGHPVRVVGSLDGLWPAGRLELGYGRLDSRRELRLWVRHLMLNVLCSTAALEGCPPVSWALGRGAKAGELAATRLAPVGDAPERLAALVALWLEARETAPPFFPVAANAYATQLAAAAAEGGGEAAALDAAAEAFGAGRRLAEPDEHPGQETDLDDDYLALLLGDQLPWDEDGQVRDPAMVARFQALSVMVYGPLRASARRERGARALALVAGEPA